VIGPANFGLEIFKLKLDVGERAFRCRVSGREGADMTSIHGSTSTRGFMAGAASLAFVMMGAAEVRAETVIGSTGTPGNFCSVDSSEDCNINGGEGESVGAGGNPAVAIGGIGGAAGGGGYGNGDGTGDGGDGGSATALATGRSRSGAVSVSASATGGAGAANLSYGGNGGDASATSKAFSGSGGASSSAYATGGFAPLGGTGGSATATADAVATRGGLATSEADATGGEYGFGQYMWAANATSTAKSTFAHAGVRSTDEATVNMATIFGTAEAYSGVATANAVAQAGGAGQTFVTPNDSAYAFSTVLPDKADVATLIGGASIVASAFLGPNDTVFGTSTLGNNDYPDGPVEAFTYSESSTFDFTYRGHLMLGLTDGGGDFSVIINGVQILEESFIDDTVINLGSGFGPNIDLTIITSVGVGDFVLGGAVPEPSTWAMMLVGFAGLGFAGCRSTRRRAASDFARGADCF
jgi:hypothetical protein